MAGVAGWVGRRALLWVVLVAVVTLAGWLAQAGVASGDIAARLARIEAAEGELAGLVAAQRGRAVTGLTAADRESRLAVSRRLAAARREREGLARRRPGPLDMLRAPRAAIVGAVRIDIERELLTQEIGFLAGLAANLDDRGRAAAARAGFDARIAAAGRRAAAAAQSEAAARAELAALAGQPWLRRHVIEGLRIVDLGAVYEARRGAAATAEAVARAEAARLVAQRRQLRSVAALTTPAVAMAALEAVVAPVGAAAAAQRAALGATLAGETRAWAARLGIDRALVPALWLLAAITLTPLAVRSLLYWVVAPLAARRPPIRLLEPGVAVPLQPGSRVSWAIEPGPDREVLIKQGFVQTIGFGGATATQGLLDWRLPLTSWAAGLVFLTRVRGGSVTVSAVRDPFAEVTLLELPAGAACVVQPRALAGVVQGVEARLRITRHWRLGSLAAWATGQLRFLVFHGPAGLILTGGRGVRIEAAEDGRSIGQDQLIGFSAGLAYKVGRTETFLPYLFGLEPLLKDRVAAGEGVLIAEEAPRAGRRGGGGRGLEGLIDAGLKLFGI